MAAPVNVLVMEAVAADIAEDIRGTAARRILSQELITALSNEGFNDSLTHLLRQWHHGFTTALDMAVATGGGAVEYTTNHYVELLGRILRDPVTGAPLEEEVFLGSDGRAYSRMTLYMFRNGAPERYRNRSPLDPMNQELFTEEPHPVAGPFVRWLCLRDPLFNDDRTRERKVAAGVFNRNMTVRIRRGEADARGERREAELAARVAAEMGRRQAAIQAAFAPADEMDARAHAAIRAEIERPDEVERIRGIAMRQDVDTMAVQIAAMQEGMPAIEARIAENNQRINGLDHRYAEINTQIQETAKAIEAKKKNEFGDAFKAILIVGASCFAAWGITQLAAAAGSSAAGTAGVSQGTGYMGFAIPL